MTYFDNGFARLYHADARHLPIPDNSVDCVVTSPPYWGLRDYGLEDHGLGLEPTPEEYCANMVEVFREVWRVLKPTGTLWLNLGDSYVSNKPKDLAGIPWRVAFALQADGWYLRSDIIWSKPNPMPESVSDRPTKAHEYMFLLTKSPRYYYDADAIREKGVMDSSSSAGSSQQDTSITHGIGVNNSGINEAKKKLRLELIENGFTTRNKRSVWEIATQPYPEAHFATFPEKLVEPCILAGCPQDGVVLDPFAGSGTTLAVAQRLGRKSIGTDLSEEYLKLASKRLGAISMPMILA
jgi:DNA modification methylase